MFKNDNGLLYRFSLSFERSEMLTDLIEKLNSMGIRTVLEWNFEPSGLQYNDNIVENYFVKSS